MGWTGCEGGVKRKRSIPEGEPYHSVNVEALQTLPTRMFLDEQWRYPVSCLHPSD